jgi:hypothetical protein
MNYRKHLTLERALHAPCTVTAATLFPRDMVCVRRVNLNTLHKGGGGDNHLHQHIHTISVTKTSSYPTDARVKAARK